MAIYWLQVSKYHAFSHRKQHKRSLFPSLILWSLTIVTKVARAGASELNRYVSMGKEWKRWNRLGVVRGRSAHHLFNYLYECIQYTVHGIQTLCVTDYKTCKYVCIVYTNRYACTQTNIVWRRRNQSIERKRDGKSFKLHCKTLILDSINQFSKATFTPYYIPNHKRKCIIYIWFCTVSFHLIDIFFGK